MTHIPKTPPTAFTDPAWLNAQYKKSDNLSARISLHGKCSTDGGQWYPWVFDQMRACIADRADILEIGAGVGDLWVRNRSKMSDGWTVTVTDRSEGMVEETKNILGADASFLYAVVDANDRWPFLDDSFDVVIANHVLHHIDQINTCLSEAARVLRPGGVFFASCLGPSHMQKFYDLIHEFDENFDAHRFDRPFNLATGTGLLSPHFFTVKIIDHQNSLVIHRDDIPLLVEYAYSMNDVASLLGPQGKAKLVDFFSDLIEQQGELVIPKEEGLFVAVV